MVYDECMGGGGLFMFCVIIMYDECMGGGGLLMFCVIWCMISAQVELGCLCSVLYGV